MHPVLFQIGSLEIRSYTVLVDIGIIVGLVIAYFEARRLRFKMEKFIDLALVVIISAIVGARIYYIVLNFPAFQADWTLVWQTWLGGLAFHGGLAGGLLAAIIYSWRAKISIWQLGDIGMPSLALGQGIGRIGCFLQGCCYGAPAALPWSVVFPYLDDEHRHPTQLYEAGSYAGLFLVLWLIRKRKPFDGFVLFGYLVLHGLIRFVVEGMRDDSVYLGGMKVAQLVALGEVAAGLFFLTFFWQRAQRSVVGDKAPAG